VQVYVSRFRKVLAAAERVEEGSQRITTDANGYRLRLGPEELDADRFARAIDRGWAVANADQPADAVDAFNEALGYWRGSPLEECAHAVFAQPHVARLTELPLSALEGLVDAQLDLDRHGEALPMLESLVAEFPGRERLTEALMIALYRSGTAPPEPVRCCRL
jgi:DNA-binding SARP family transcriptional activator